MSRLQIIFTLAAVLLVAVLFMLPKGIVSKDEKAGLQSTATAGTNNAPATEGHVGAAPNEATEPHLTASPKVQSAIASLRKQLALVVNPQQKRQLYDTLGGAYKAAGRYDSAGYFYEQAAQGTKGGIAYKKAADQYFQAYSFAATEDRKTMLSTKTRSLYEQVLKDNPGNTAAKINLAMVLTESETPMKGILMMREVLEQDPTNQEALYKMGMLSMQSGQYAKAVERFRKLTELNPKHVNGQFYLGVSLVESGNKEEARRVLQKVKTMSQDPALQTSVEEYLARTNS